MNDSNPFPDKDACYRLIGAIISKAVEDANLTDDFINDSSSESLRLSKFRNRKQARIFFYGPIFKKYCELTGLNPSYIRTALTPSALEEAKQYKKEKEDARKRLQKNVQTIQ